MKISFIIVTYQTPQEEKLRLKSEILKSGFGLSEIYFIDNTKNKKGYAYGVNQGIKKAIQNKTDIFVILNPDISVDSIRKENILELLKTFDIGGFSMEQNGVTYYGGTIEKWRMSGGLNKAKPINRYLATDFVTGSCMVIKKSVIEAIGLFDESYGMYYEDVDYCYRARKAGFNVGIDSQHSYSHFETSAVNPNKEKWLSQSRLHFFLRYSNAVQKVREFIRIPKTLLERKN